MTSRIPTGNSPDFHFGYGNNGAYHVNPDGHVGGDSYVYWGSYGIK